ncbi:Hypothetical Protein FCC1311_034642 [Hondaea fermentalgiana]|uniref:Uncharacterized protein n=1 Tax=Hondaea fermentalgiana TaxID=2315210 RepID=A0A2R5G860_9STRA|nr:Hypothetical Protein FCC1311_034642 [Hondaea fermentalgiana]|eukprot:GBG27242.1 Hypothetical Protein FCC1311_034642 [Hondaea fermentalgiana]
MVRSVLSGGLFFAFFASLAFVLASALPLWWYTTTELEGEMCACGTGLWRANFTWGDDLTQENLLDGPYRCSADSLRMTKGCDAAAAQQPETRLKGQIAGGVSIAAVAASLCSVAFAFLCVIEGSDPSRFRRQHVLWAAASATAATILEIVVIAVFMSAPLFDNLAYNFQCHFVFDHALNSNPLRCQALGPSFGLALGGCILNSFACAMFYIALTDPLYIDPTTGRYSMFEHTLLGARPLDPNPVTVKPLEQEEITSRRSVAGSAGTGASATHSPLRTSIADDGNERGVNGGKKEIRTVSSREDGATAHLLGGGSTQETQENTNAFATIAARDEEQDSQQEMIDLDGSAPRPAFRQPSLSPQSFIKVFGVPTLLIFNAALFTWSNCSTGATVEPAVVISFPPELRWLGHKFFPHQVDAHGVVALKDDVFNFTILTSLRHFWNGHAYGLAILIGTFSGCWPYIKIFTMLCLWFIPAREKLRGKLLHWLDVLGKWSLVDAYVLCLMAVAFGFNADKTIAGVSVHVDMSVRPGWGVYSFVLATMWSLCMSHFMTYLHRHAMERRANPPSLTKAMERPPREALASRPYAPFPRRRRFTCSQFGQGAMWFVLLVTLATTILGQLVRTFEFRFSGLADLILVPERRNTTYSLVSNGLLLPEACSKGGFLSGGDWAWFMTIMYFIFAMVIPIVMLIALAILWGVPMTLRSTKRVFHVCQILQAWSALDVFIVSIVAAVLEIGSLSEAILSNSFAAQQEGLCSFLKGMPRWMLDHVLHSLGLPSIDAELEHCALFRVDAVLLEGTWMLLSGIVAWAICTQLVMEFADASIVERTRILRVLSFDDGTDDEGGLALRAEPGDESLDPYERLRMQGNDEDLSGSAEDEAENAFDRANDTTQRHQEVSLIQHDDSVLEELDGPQAPLLRPLRENGAAPNGPPTSVYLARILRAQEEGARRYMGSFGDGMYGPFPRTWWPFFKQIGLLEKVAWDQVGFDIHAALLMNAFAERDNNRATEDSALNMVPWTPRSPYAEASPAQDPRVSASRR